MQQTPDEPFSLFGWIVAAFLAIRPYLQNFWVRLYEFLSPILKTLRAHWQTQIIQILKRWSDRLFILLAPKNAKEPSHKEQGIEDSHSLSDFPFYDPRKDAWLLRR